MSAAIGSNHKNYLSNIRQVLLLFFQHQTWKNNKALQNFHWTCSNVQLNYGLRMYYLFLHVKIKTVQKVSQFSCFHVYFGVFSCRCRFYATFKSVALWKLSDKNRAKLFVLNGNKRLIRYEFHNVVKPNRCNGNMVQVTTQYRMQFISQTIRRVK